VPVTNPPGPLLLYEPFDYPSIGSPVSSNTPANWAYGGSNPNDLNVAPGNLSYPGLVASVGNSVTNGGAGLGVRRLFGSGVSSGVLYFSALFRINDLGFGVWTGSPSGGTQVGALTADDSGTFRLAIMVKSNSPAGYVFGVQKAGGSATFDTVERHAGETVFLVGKYDFMASPNAVRLWINPASAAFGAASEPTGGFISQSTGTDGYTIDRFNLRQNTAANVPAAMQWDELRVGTSWANVTPPPADAPTLLTDPTRLPDGAFRFSYTNSSSQPGTVYASTNLTNWAATGTATQFAPGLFRFTDTAATNHPRRFYKLRSL
jgi:hypothetical protein